MPRAFAAPPSLNLKPFLAQLEKESIDYRLIERDGLVELWVADAHLADRIAEAFSHYESAQKQTLSFNNIKQVPVTAICMLISIVVAVVTQLGDQFVEHLIIADVTYFPHGWRWEPSFEYVLRIFTPTFVHFGIEHLIFNMLALWYLGQMLERALGPWMMVAMILTFSMISNVAQLLVDGPLFGGFSGVVYAFIGFAFVYQKLAQNLNIPNGLFVFAGIWLLLGFADAFTGIGISMANTAHLSGLIAGIVLSICWILWNKVLDEQFKK